MRTSYHENHPRGVKMGHRKYGGPPADNMFPTGGHSICRAKIIPTPAAGLSGTRISACVLLGASHNLLINIELGYK